MTRYFAKTTALVAALMLGAASIPAYAIDVNVGDGGVSVGTGGSTGANNATANVGQGSGPLANVDSNGDPTTGEGSQTDGDVNLGSLLAGVDLGDIGLDDIGDGTGAGGAGGNGGAGGAGAGSAGFQRLAANLSAGDRDTLKLRCLKVLANPETQKSDVINFCRMIAKL